MKIKPYLRLQVVGWSIYWISLLILNIFFFKNKDYGTLLLIVWTILFTGCGIVVFYLLTRFYNWLIIKNIDTIHVVILIILASFFGAYIWGIFEPLISWAINPKIKQAAISWDINSRHTIPFTFVVAFFGILYYFSKLLEQSKPLTETHPVINEENASLNDTIAVYLKNSIVLLPIKNIRKISIVGNYSSIVDNNNVIYELKKPLVKWENDLPKKSFLRIHRSTIINKNNIEKIEPWFNYTFRIRMANSDTPEEVSRRYSALIKKELNL
ncbi:MAG: LytTR family DNA-binding domain-containing protein [Bacteroidales bacterium]|jgi:hypothetical protein